MAKRRLNNKLELLAERRELRKNGTLHEAVLWKLLKNRQQSGIRFRRQFSVGPYILDFYAPEIKLAIELDGQGHFTEHGLEHDHIRDTYLHTQGITVLRFENIEIFRLQTQVLAAIEDKITELTNPLK